MTEYVIIVGLIAIVSISVVERLSKSLEKAYIASANAIDRRVTAPMRNSKVPIGGTATLPGSTTLSNDPPPGDTAEVPPKKKPETLKPQ